MRRLQITDTHVYCSLHPPLGPSSDPSLIRPTPLYIRPTDPSLRPSDPSLRPSDPSLHFVSQAHASFALATGTDIALGAGDFVLCRAQEPLLALYQVTRRPPLTLPL